MDRRDEFKQRLADERKKFIEHERASRANQGRNPFPLQVTLRWSLPLFGLAIFLYGSSLYYTKKWKTNRQQKRLSQEATAKALETDSDNTVDLTPGSSQEAEILADDKTW